MLAVLLLAGCGGNDGGGEGDAAPSVADVPGGPGAAGGQVAVRSGCLACHRLGSAGNDGPGGDLTRIGGTLSRAEIARSLVDPPSPMPSYESLPRADRELLAEYLAGLR